MREEISPELLAILACPASQQKLISAGSEVLSKVTEDFAAGQLKKVDGTYLKERFTGLLIREDKSVAYRILEGIPILLVEEGIKLE